MNTQAARRNAFAVIVAVVAILASGCASVPMGSKDEDTAAKTFALPAQGKVGLYVYRNSFVGQALSKTLSIDGMVIGKTANKVYFYKEISPGNHTLTTESEFGDNSITFEAVGGRNYYARQYIKMGVFIGGSGIEMVDEDVGKKEILECSLAKPL